MNKEEIEYIERAEAIVWKLATIVKGNIEILENIDRQIEHTLPHLRVKIEDAILMQMRTYQKVNELFPRLDEIENKYVRNQSNQLSLSGKSITLHTPRIWNLINIVSKLKPSSMQNNWRYNLESNLGISISASYVRKPIHNTSFEAKYNAPPIVKKPRLVVKLSSSELIGKEQIRRKKKYTDYLKSVGISGKIGQVAIIERILTSSNLVLKRD